jgi:hypothetical protein
MEEAAISALLPSDQTRMMRSAAMAQRRFGQLSID